MGYNFMEILANNVKRLRNKLHISQMELALRADVSLAFINAIEHKQKWVSAKTLDKLAEALSVHPYELFLTNEIDTKDLEVIADKHKEMVIEIKDIINRYSK